MLFILIFKQVTSISQYNDHMILNQNEKYVIPSVYYKYNYNMKNENIIQDNKYIMFEHILDIGQFVYGLLDKNQLWLLSYQNGKFDLNLINLPIDIMNIKLQISIESQNCYKIDIFQDNQIIIACFNECYNFYYVYNWRLRKLKQYKLKRKKCKVETYNILVIDDQDYIVVQYDNIIEIIDYQFALLCQMEFQNNINKIYYNNNLYIYTSLSNYYQLSQQSICKFYQSSYTLNENVIIGNEYQIFMDSENNICINGVYFKINPKNLFFNDKYLIFQSFNIYYVFDYDNQQLITTIQENENSKIFVNIDLLDIYIIYDNKMKLINIQESAYQIINSQYSLDIQFKEQLQINIVQQNQSSIMLSQLYFNKLVISQNQTQIRMGPFNGGNLHYKFLQNNNQDVIQVDVKVINYKIIYQQECIFFQIYNHNKYNLFICQHYNLTITIYKSMYSIYERLQSYTLDQQLTQNDNMIIQEILRNEKMQYLILRVTNNNFKLYGITNFTQNLDKQINFDKLNVFDNDYIYYTINNIMFRYIISQQIIEVVTYGSSQIFIDQKNYFVYAYPYLSYYCQNNQLSQQIYVGHNLLDVCSFNFAITIIMKGQIQLYHRLNRNKILYIGNIDLYDQNINETCQFISDNELLYVRCHTRLLIFDSQQSLQQSLMKNFETTHSFPLKSASKLHVCFEELPNQISCYFVYQQFEFTYQFLKQIHTIQVDLQVIAYNKYNQESLTQVILFQNDIQLKQQQDHIFKYQAYKGQTTFKIDIKQNSIRQQNYLYSDFYELTRLILTHQSLATKSLNFIILIENDDFRVYDNDQVSKQLQTKALFISVVDNTILYYNQNQSLQFYQCNIYLQCNFTQKLDLEGIIEFRVLQFGNRIIIQQKNFFNIYKFEQNSKQMIKILQIERVFQAYDIFEDIIVYLIDQKLIIETQNIIQEYDLQYFVEFEYLEKINKLVILNNQIDICISDGYQVVIYRFQNNKQPFIRAVLFKEYLLGQRLQCLTLQMNNSIIIVLDFQTQMNFYIYQDIQDIQYLYPIKIIQSGFSQMKRMQLFKIKEQIVVVFKQATEIKIIHLQIEQYLVLETGIQKSQIIQLKMKNQPQLTILLHIQIPETDYYLVCIIFLILIYAYLKYLQIN